MPVLAHLRRKFVAITMILTGMVLVAVLGFTLFSTWNTQRGLIDDTLSRSLDSELNTLPILGIRDRPDGRRDANMLVLSVDVSTDGVVLETSRAPITIHSDILSEVLRVAVDKVVSQEGEIVSGSDGTTHVAWKARQTDSNTIRVVIADTTAMDSALSVQVGADLAITAAGLAALFALTWWLSGWALAPVARAWDEQRRFVADASHELKTPLAVIIANMQILEREEDLPKEAQKWIASTSDEAEQMKSLVNDLLELARADEGATGRIEIAHDEVNLSELTDGVALEFDAVAFERGSSLDTSIEPEIYVVGNAEWLERLVRILIDNAVKYAEVGTPIRITLTSKSGHSHHAILSVNNKGSVIAPDEIPHVFDRFYRSDKARTKGDSSGFGLGLAIAKGIVDAHGGTIRCTSDENNGTTFTITL